MLDGHQIHSKSILSKYQYFFALIFFVLFFKTLDSFAQRRHIETSLFKEGLLELKFQDSWRYYPGDSLEWAEPNFDDSKWYKIDPFDLKAYQIPGSLWNGFG